MGIRHQISILAAQGAVEELLSSLAELLHGAGAHKNVVALGTRAQTANKRELRAELITLIFGEEDAQPYRRLAAASHLTSSERSCKGARHRHALPCWGCLVLRITVGDYRSVRVPACLQTEHPSSPQHSSKNTSCKTKQVR